MGLIKKIINGIENHPTQLINFIGSFLVIVLLRNFIEMYATGQEVGLLQVLTYSPFYLALALWFIWYFSFFTNEPVLKSARIVLFFFILIVIPPIIDIIFSSPGNVRMRYLGISDKSSFWINLLTVGMADEGISWGQRIEIITACIFGYFYFYSKLNSVFKSILLAYGIYLWIFLFGTFLILLNLLFRKIGVMYVKDNLMLAKMYFIIGLLAFIVILFTRNRNLAKLILMDSRPLRLLHYYLFLAFGFLLYYFNQPSEKLPVFFLTNDNIFLFILIPISIYFAAIFSLIDNNIRDIDIDKISNPDRPHVKENSVPEYYALSGKIALGISLVAALLAGRVVFIIMALVIGLYFLYSSPPFRLKKVIFLGKFVVGVNSFLICLMGYLAFGGPPLTFPLDIAFFLIIPLSFAVNFIDLKDIEGDSHCGILTLPTWLGIRKAQWVIAFFTLTCYLNAAWILKEQLKQPLYAIGIALLFSCHMVLLTRKKYRELPVMLCYLFSILSFMIIYFM